MAYWPDTGTGTPTDPGTTAVIDALRQYFTDGGAGVAPSVPGAEWFNMITDEVLAVLAEAGIAPDKASHTQLRDAIKAIMANKAATQAEVNDSNPATQVDKFITVKTLWGWVKQASETVLGMMKVATQAETNAGALDTVAVTPKKLRAGFSILLGPNGFIAFPTWMGGPIIQWGIGTTTPIGAVTTKTFPIAFPSACLMGVASYDNYGVGGATPLPSIGFSVASPSTFVLSSATYSGGSQPNAYWIAIGK